MKCDIIVCGVGGQGGLSAAALIAEAALKQGLHVKQNEIHGMSQRGGAVVASLRISDQPILSSRIPQGMASLILSMEPLESLRYLGFLSMSGKIVSTMAPVMNLPDYPKIETIFAQIRAVPGSMLIDAEKLAREAGSARAVNILMVAAASRFLPIKEEIFLEAIKARFAQKGAEVVNMNLKAFEIGKNIIPN